MFVFQCNLPDVEECMRLAETIQADGDVFETIKYYLLSTEPEKALPVGIQYVKGRYLDEEQFLSKSHLYNLPHEIFFILFFNRTALWLRLDFRFSLSIS